MVVGAVGVSSEIGYRQGPYSACEPKPTKFRHPAAFRDWSSSTPVRRFLVWSTSFRCGFCTPHQAKSTACSGAKSAKSRRTDDRSSRSAQKTLNLDVSSEIRQRSDPGRRMTPTAFPSASRRRVRCDPTNPAAPVNKMRERLMSGYHTNYWKVGPDQDQQQKQRGTHDTKQ